MNGTIGRNALGALVVAIATVLALAPLASAKAPKRIVAITPFSANTLAGLGIKPVAIGEGLGGPKQLDPKLRNVPTLPLSHASNGPNLEQLAALDPDTVLSERTWTAGRNAIEDLGIDVYEVDPYSVGEVRLGILRIGAIVEREKRARKLAAKTVREIRAETRGIESRPRVLMILGVGQTPYAFLPNSWGGDLIEQAGGTLLTEGLSSDNDDLLLSGGYAQLSNEEILVRNPDVIIAVPHGSAEDVDEIAAGLRENEYFEETNAGANDRVYVTTDNTLLQGSTEVAKTIRQVRTQYLLND